MDTNTCANCNTANTTSRRLKACNNCKTVAYCDRNCQKAHFKAHKKACREQKAAEDRALKDQSAQIAADRDDMAEDAVALLAETVADTYDVQHNSLWLRQDEEGNQYYRNADGSERVLLADTFVFKEIPPTPENPRGRTVVHEFSQTIKDTMVTMTKKERVAFHDQIELQMMDVLENSNLKFDSEILKAETKALKRLAKEERAKKATACISEGQ